MAYGEKNDNPQPKLRETILTKSPQNQSIYELLPFILNPDNIARFDAGKVIIGDRRAYPFSESFVHCGSVDEVAVAIKDMVTQGSGPWLCAVQALRIITYRQMPPSPQGEQQLRSELKSARDTLVATRPTNTAMRIRLDEILLVAEKAITEGRDVDVAVASAIEQTLHGIFNDYSTRARAMADLIEDGDGLLTNCFAEAGFILALAFAKKDGKKITVYAPETRPYLQGAKLTAPSIHEIGIDVNLITDNMPAAIMSEGKIQKYITAADLITIDGHVVNKIGTYQSAIAARAHDIPFYAFAWGRDNTKATRKDIVIEERDPSEIRSVLGLPTTIEDIKARYPTFDITPPNYVSGIVTIHGVLSTDALTHYSNW